MQDNSPKKWDKNIVRKIDKKDLSFPALSKLREIKIF